MLQEPDLEDEVLIAHLRRGWSLPVDQVNFLPLGADPATAVYRAVGDGEPYFVKLRRGVPFDETSVTLLEYLSENGVGHIIPPLPASSGKRWTRFGAFTVTLCPYVEGTNGYSIRLTEENWLDFGLTLEQLHTLNLPPRLLGYVRREHFDAWGRDTVKAFLARLDNLSFATHASAEMAAFLTAKRRNILELVDRAGSYARILRERTPELVLCHGDLHAGNVLIDGENDFYIVDWDDPILAPKERDLMFIGGGLGFIGREPEEEERLFYRGYGRVELDPVALAYYRFERIIQDIAVYCHGLSQDGVSDEDREQSLHYLRANFEPGGTIERAYAANAVLDG